MFNEYLEVITGDGQKITLSSHFSENSKKSILINHGMAEHPVSYTHLTLPTIREV